MHDNEPEGLPRPSDVKRLVEDFLDDPDEGGDWSFDREPRRPAPTGGVASRKLTKGSDSNWNEKSRSKKLSSFFQSGPAKEDRDKLE